MNKPIHPNFFIPETFGDAVSYEVQVKYLHQRLKALEEEGIPTPDLTELKQRVTTLETEVSAIQGEIEDLDLESITAKFEQIDADIEQLQATQSQQGATIQGYNTRLLELETTTDLQDQAIDALDGRVTGVTTAVSNVVAEQTQMAQDIAGKQDQLTAGANITIQNNVISASGGGGTIDIDTTVTANSQHAVTSEGIYNAIQTAKTAVETQHTTDINRIDGELAGKASTASVTTLRGDMEDEIERVEGDYQDADTALDTRLTAVETAQTTTEGNVTTLQQNVTTLQQTQTSQGTAIQGIRGRLDTAESNITQLQTSTSTLSGDVSSLQQTVSGKQDQLTAGTNITIQNNVISASGGGGQVTLDDTVTETSSNGVKSSGIYTAIQNAKSDMATQDAAIQADLTALTTRVDDVEDDVEQAQTDISTLQTGQQTLTTNLSSETSAREAADQALRIDVNANASAINTLRTNTNASITQLQTDVAGKQDKLTAGDNISIINNVISALSGGGSTVQHPSTVSEYEDQRENYWEPLSCSSIMNLIRIRGENQFVINTGKFVVPIFSETESESEFVPVNTQTIWVASLPAQIQEHSGLDTWFGNPSYTEVSVDYMFGMWNEWVGVNRSTISDGLYNAPTQDITYSDDSLDITDIPLYPKCPNAFNHTLSQTYPPKLLKGYCVWVGESATATQGFPLGIMLVELKNIPAHTHSEFSANTPLTANYKCLKWISVNSTYTGIGFGNRKAQEFLITPIY